MISDFILFNHSIGNQISSFGQGLQFMVIIAASKCLIHLGQLALRCQSGKLNIKRTSLFSIRTTQEFHVHSYDI